MCVVETSSFKLCKRTKKHGSGSKKNSDKSPSGTSSNSNSNNSSSTSGGDNKNDMIKSENKKFIKFVNNPTSSSSATSSAGSSSSGTSSSSSSSNIDNKSNIKSENNESECLFKFVIISYSLIPLMIEKLLPLNFNVVIADESHYLKNAKAARTINMLLLLRKSVRAILLSGTPALSRPLELFTQLNSLDPETWPCIKAFGRR